MQALSVKQLCALLKKGIQLPLAIKNYPSRGQTALQELYQTSRGKFFLKKSSRRNHIDCQIVPKTGTLAEREYWAFCLAKKIGLKVPELWLVNQWTTVQIWLDIPDARQYTTVEGKMPLKAEDVFNCSLFDWMTGQVDRHDANYLYDYVNQEIILIDSAHAFLKYSGSIPDYLRYFEIGFPKEITRTCNTPVQRKIVSLNDKELSRLIPLREADEQKMLQLRWLQIKKVSTLREMINLYRGNKK